MTGTATKADLRYSGSPITADNFCQATPVNPLPSPGSGGSARQYLVTGLSSCSTFYFAMKYWDEVNNVSVFGDTAVATTMCQCCIADARARLTSEEGSSSRRTGAVERAAAGPRATGNATPAAIALSNPGTGLVVEATPGPGGLDVKMFALANEFEGHAVASDGGVLLQRPDGTGHWATRLGYDLPPSSRFALCAPEKPTRWVFLAPCAINGVLPAVRGEGAAWRLASAQHSRLGDVTTAFTLADTLPRLGVGDTLAVHYAAAPDTGALPQGWMLVLDRSSADPLSARAGRHPAQEGSAIPTVFALRQNQPNPFVAKTTIRFALPVASRVKLEVFDLLGRRVRTLVNAPFDAGEHEVTWNRSTGRGALASPGLYFYRMEAGQYREKRTMMIVP